jgi:hypothetical protein
MGTTRDSKTEVEKNSAQQLLEQYFDTDPIEFVEPEPTDELCSVEWCDFLATPTGFCTKHQRYFEQGLVFKNQFEQIAYEERLKGKRCAFGKCQNKTQGTRKYCSVHETELVCYGEFKYNIDGSHKVSIFKGTEFKHRIVRAFVRNIDSFIEVVVDKDQVDKIRYAKFHVSKKNGKLYIRVVGKLRLLLYYLFGKGKRFIPTSKFDCDRSDIIKINGGMWDFRRESYIELQPKVYNHLINSRPDLWPCGYKCVSYDEKKRQWKFQIRITKPRIGHTKYFYSMEEAVIYRDIVHKALFGEEFVKVFPRYNDEEPIKRKLK